MRATKKRPKHCLLLCVLTVLWLVPAASLAQEGRTLGGYRFIPVSFVADPFITRHFRNATGIATASNVDIPIIIIERTPPEMRKPDRASKMS